MNFTQLYLRCRWLHAPAGLLIVLLQRTPVLRVLSQAECFIENNGSAVIKSVFGLIALGAYNSVAGATTFSVSPATPATGPVGQRFAISGTVGTAMSEIFTLTGAPGSPRSWGVTGTLPPGLSVTGGNPINVTAPFKMTIAGTPTTTGSWTVTVSAWESSNTSGSRVDISCVFSITGGTANTAPAFTTQPQGATVTVGSPVTFSAIASGSPAPTYQWQKGGTNIAGATTSSYSISSAQTTNAGSYTVVATNVAGSATSTAATLTVNAAAVAPSISSQPQNATVNTGASASFSVVASGSAPLSYQWLKGGVSIAGATGSTHSISSAQASDAGSYTVAVSNSAGAVTSSAATLTVQAAPVITAQPQNISVTIGSSASFSVAAGSSTPLSYQWQKGTVAIPGATSATYTISSAQTSDAGNYAVVVTNGVGSVTSSLASLTVTTVAVAPSITAQPQNTTVTVGGIATLSVTATGSAPITYQWKKAGAAVSGATSATYSITGVQSSDAGNYTVVVTNGAGTVTSSIATLTVNAAAAPSITAQPQSTTVTVGNSVSFSVTATGTAPLSYQWRKGSTSISSATNSSYTIPSPQVADAGTYTVIVSNVAGSVTSSGATLTVNPAGSAPTITTQPASQTVATGHNVSFSFAASANPAASYQWSVSSDGGATWASVQDGTTYAGATTGTLTVKNAGIGMSGYLYRCTASNSSGSVNSSSLTLSVAAPIFPAPVGLAINGAGVIFVSDSSNNTIQAVSTSWQASVLAGTSGQQGTADGTGAAALFRQPGGIAIDSAGNLYVADAGNSIIRKITSAGVVTTLAGSASNQGFRDGVGTAAWFNSPAAIAVDNAGILYVADSGNAVIRKIAVDGTVSTLAGTAGATGSTDGSGASARFNQPSGIALDATGNLYVADRVNQLIRKITAGGVVTTLAGVVGKSGAIDGTGLVAEFNLPQGLCADGAGNLYVADTGNSAIRKVTSSGNVTTVAGLSSLAGLLDGPGATAWLNQPKDVKIDAAGNLYVADTGNAAIRKITPAAVVTTPTITAVASPPPVNPPGTPSGSGGSTTSAPGKSGAGSLDGWFVLGLLVLGSARRTLTRR